MRFQTRVTPESPSVEERWLSTDVTQGQAEQLAAALRARGYTVTTGQDEAEPGELYDQVGIPQPGVWTSLFGTGAFVSADDDFASEDNGPGFWTAVVATLEALHELFGWRAVSDNEQWARTELSKAS